MYQLSTWLALIVCILICLGAAAIGSAATIPQIDAWYTTINKPSWNPPNYVFGPVWTVLYVMMGVSLWLVWISSDAKRWRAIALFAIQLSLNVAWSWIFFAMHSPGWAFLDIVLLWTAIAATICLFWPISKISSALLVPYFLWVSFAALLNFAIWQMNAG